MDIIESRNISYSDNIIKKADGSIQNNKHTLKLHKEGPLYIISLYDNRTRISDKKYLSRKHAVKCFNKLVKKYSFVISISSPQTPVMQKPASTKKTTPKV